MYIRKTRDEYELQGDYGYGYGWECLVPYDTLSEARQDLRLYRENEPGVPFRIVKHRIPLTTDY